jgi:hypothetical protein
VDGEHLSLPGSAAFARVENALSPTLLFSKGFLGFDAHIESAIEVRARTNDAIPWMRGRVDSPTFLKPELSLYAADHLFFTVEPGLGVDPYLYEDETASWNTNFPFVPFERIDANSPLRAFGALGGPWWSFQIGRDKLSFGSGKTGNLAVSDTPDYYDFGRIALFFPNFKYSFLISQFPMNTDELIPPSLKTAGGETYQDTTQRYLYLHRMDLRLFNTLSIGMSEGIMVANSPLELRYLNPIMIFHSFYPWKDYPDLEWAQLDLGGSKVRSSLATGSVLTAEIEWAIIPSLAAYGQFVMNELAFVNEVQMGIDLPPNGLGYLAGVEYVRAIKNWRAGFFGEFVYTDPYLYTLSNPFASFISMRRLSETMEKPLRYQWIGHSLGRDAMLFTLGMELYQEFLSIAPELSFTRRGEHTIRYDWQKSTAAFNEKTPTGIPENFLSLGVEAVWRPVKRLRLSAYIAGGFLFDAGHVPGANEAGAEFTFSAAFRY